MKFIRTPLALACVGLCSTPLHAAERLEEITVVSSRVAMPLRQVGTSVSIISAQELQIRGFDGVAEALRYEPGISVTNNGGAGKTTALNIRGERSFRTKVYIDGIDVTDTSAPQAGPNFEHIASAGIERIEILRGPQGMMYGADAGGVVSITTLRPAQGITGGASGEYGRYDTSDLQGHVAGGSALGDFAVTAAQYDTDGFDARTTDDTVRDEDGYDNTTAHARLGWNITEGLRLEGVGRVVEGDTDYDTCSLPVTFEPTDDCTSDYEQDAWRAALVHSNERFGNTLSYNSNSTDRRFYSVGQRSYATRGDLEEVRYLGHWAPADALRLAYGVDLRSEAVDDGAVDPDRDQAGYYAEYQGGFNDRIFLTAGARYDDNDDFGSETTYRASAAYLLPMAGGETKFRGSYGTGFRAPSLSEIVYNQSPDAYPPASDASLGAEKSEGYDIGAGYFANSGWLLEVVYFDQTVADEIYFDVIDFSGYLQEDGDSNSQGVEVIGEAPVTAWLALTANYTYNDTEDSDGEQRIRAPEQLANLGLRITPESLPLVVNLNLRASSDAADEENGAVDDYEVLDLSATYQLLPALGLFGRVVNLTDEDYEESPTYRSSGAAAYAGVRYTF